MGGDTGACGVVVMIGALVVVVDETGAFVVDRHSESVPFFG